MSSVDDKEDENDNKSSKGNDWESFRKDIVNYLTYIIAFSLVGGLFLVHVGGNLFLSKDDLSNIQKNNPNLHDIINKIKSIPMQGIDQEKAPYTRVGDDPDDDAFFSLHKWAFPYKNFFNENPEWEFKKDNWEEAKPIMYICGKTLEKMFSGSYSTGRWLIETIRKWGNKEAINARSLNGKSIMPTVLFWFMGITLTIFLYYGIWHYSLFSVIIFAILNFIFGTLEIFNLPDPPVKKSQAEIEMEKAMKKATQSGGADPVGTNTTATNSAVAANPAANPAPVGILGDASAIQALGKAAEGVADKADNIVDKNVDKAATYPADLLKKTGATAAASSAIIAIKDTVMGIIYGIFWFFKRLFKTFVLAGFTWLMAAIGSMINAIWQPLMFIGWFIIGPIFNDGQRKLLSQYIQKQKWNIALLVYISILMSCYNNLQGMHPEYMVVGGVIILCLILFGKIK
tara:strand:- start:61 stop:1431 length:1371 start_codon:yes stop_codon:yes gene_type:complete